MNFVGLGASQLLTLLAAFGGAMVLLYLLKLRRRRVEVPFTPLWARVVEERAASSLFDKLKRVLSLLIQLAVVALVVLALGEPRLAGLAGCTYEPPEPPPTRHTLLLIDASASMATVEGGRTRLEAAREAAHEVVTGLAGRESHRVMVVQVDAATRPRSLWTDDAATLRAAIDAVAPSGALDTTTAVDDALALAEAALAGREGAEVVFITDAAFPPAALRQPAASQRDPERATALDLRLIPVAAPDAGANIGVDAFNVRPYLDDSLTYAIFYAVRNDTDRRLPATLFLYANDAGRSVDDFVQPHRVVASYALDLPPRGRVEAVIDDVKFEGSRLAARVQIATSDPARDVFPRDDVAFALVPERKRLAVQLVTAGNLFLNATLFIRENVALTTVAPEDYQGPEGFDVTVVDGVAVDMSRPGNYFVVDPQPGGPFALEGVLREPQVARFDKGHAIARHLKLVDLNVLEAAHVTRVRGDEVVAATAGGAPLLMTRTDAEGGRRFVALTFDLKKSLLPMNYAFPLLVVNVLSWFHQEADGLLEPNRAGVELSLALPLPEGPIAVAGPADAGEVRARRVGERVHLAVDRVGVYELTVPGADDRDDDGADARAAVAINLMDPEEGQIAPRLAADGADADPTTEPTTEIDAARAFTPWVAPPPVVREDDPWLASFWRVLLLAALALVAVEWLTWNRRVTV